MKPLRAPPFKMVWPAQLISTIAGEAILPKLPGEYAVRTRGLRVSTEGCMASSHQSLIGTWTSEALVQSDAYCQRSSQNSDSSFVSIDDQSSSLATQRFTICSLRFNLVLSDLDHCCLHGDGFVNLYRDLRGGVVFSRTLIPGSREAPLYRPRPSPTT